MRSDMQNNVFHRDLARCRADVGLCLRVVVELRSNCICCGQYVVHVVVCIFRQVGG